MKITLVTLALLALAVPAAAQLVAPIPSPGAMWQLHLAADTRLVRYRGKWWVIRNKAALREAVALQNIKRRRSP